MGGAAAISPPPPSSGVINAHPSAPVTTANASAPSQPKRAPRIVRRKKKGGTSAADAHALPSHLRNNAQLHHVVAATLPRDYDFEIAKTIWRIEEAGAVAVALQLPEGLLMYASAIGDILIKFAYQFRPPGERDGGGPTAIRSLSILGDVTYGACCIDDLSARALGCDLLVHYGHSCLVPLTRTVIPCLYIFVEIRVDVQHLVDCVQMTFAEEERGRQGIVTAAEEEDADTGSTSATGPTRVIEALVMGTVQFRSAVIEASERLNNNETANGSSEVVCPHRVHFQAIVPQAKPLSPGEVLGCTAPSGLALLDFQAALAKVRRRQTRKKKQQQEVTAATSAEFDAALGVTRERVMVFVADGRFHLEAAMIANPSLRALRYDPYGKTLTEERYDTAGMKRLRRKAIMQVRTILGIGPPSRKIVAVNGDPANDNSDNIANSVLGRQSPQYPSCTTSSPSASPLPITMGIILGTLGRQGNPAILSRLRALLCSRGIRPVIVLLSEILPRKLRLMSAPGHADGGGVAAWVQVACPRLSIDWGHHFCVPVLSPFELYVALGEVADPSLWAAKGGDGEEIAEGGRPGDGYPMDFYSKSGGPWANYYDSARSTTSHHR